MKSKPSPTKTKRSKKSAKRPSKKKPAASKRKKQSARKGSSRSPSNNLSGVSTSATFDASVASGQLTSRVAIVDPSKRIAVYGCVNATLNNNRPVWNQDGRGDDKKMGDELKYNTKSMPAFLDTVRRCLLPKYTFNYAGMSMESCVAATVFGLKELILAKTN